MEDVNLEPFDFPFDKDLFDNNHGKLVLKEDVDCNPISDVARRKLQTKDN